MFADAFAGEPKDCDLAAILEAIRGEKYRHQVTRARELFAAWKKVCPALDSKLSPEAQAYDEFKKTLPAFCFSGTARSRKEPGEHSGFLQIDFDKLNGTLDALNEKLKSDPMSAVGLSAHRATA